MITVDASQMFALAADLSAAAAQVGQAEAVITKTAYDIESTSKTLAPVDTGNLRSSISTDITSSGDSIEAEVGPTAEYAAYVEEGTSVMSPQPYMGPAFDRHVAGLEAALADVAGNLL